MSKSDIVFQINYKKCKNKKLGIKSWLDYSSKKQKADSSSIDEYNLLKDYALFSDKETYLNESYETYLWTNNGDVLKKDAITKLDDSSSGFFWRGFLSFPPDFAINHGLITKADYYSLSNKVITSLILDMGLNLNNVTWYCALHRDTNHPHIHFCIYENKVTRTNPTISKMCYKNFRSNVGNYLVDYQKFYELRDKTFTNITGTVSLSELNKIKKQRLFSDKYRSNLNKMLLDLYSKLPATGRLQYNSHNIDSFRDDLNKIIEFILLHDSVKYDYAKYLKMLNKHQKELNSLYGMTADNQKRKYYEDQKRRLYSKIGNEILANYKRYQSTDFMERESKFLNKHINELNFKSRKDYAKDETRISIAKDLYKICVLANLNDKQTKKVFEKWIRNSGYLYDVNALLSSIKSSDTTMSTKELYDALKRLGYSSNRYNKFKSKNFYQELNYKRFINQAINSLYYEMDREEKEILENMEYELEVKK